MQVHGECTVCDRHAQYLSYCARVQEAALTAAGHRFSPPRIPALANTSIANQSGAAATAALTVHSRAEASIDFCVAQRQAKERARSTMVGRLRRVCIVAGVSCSPALICKLLLDAMRCDAMCAHSERVCEKWIQFSNACACAYALRCCRRIRIRIRIPIHLKCTCVCAQCFRRRIKAHARRPECRNFGVFQTVADRTSHC